MAVELTAEQQAIRTSGMQVFGIRLLADKVERALLNTHRGIRGSSASWRSSVTASSTKDKPALELTVIVRSIREQVATATGGSYARAKELPEQVQNACESYLGYPTGFLALSFLIIDHISSAADEMDETTTESDLIAFLDLIDLEMSEEPTL